MTSEARSTTTSAPSPALKRYRLQTSFIIKKARGKEFASIVRDFRDALGQEGRNISEITVEPDSADHRLVVSFDIKADSFSDANLRSGIAILKSLKEATVDTGDLAEIERLKDVNKVDRQTSSIVDDQSTQLTLV